MYKRWKFSTQNLEKKIVKIHKISLQNCKLHCPKLDNNRKQLELLLFIIIKAIVVALLGVYIQMQLLCADAKARLILSLTK